MSLALRAIEFSFATTLGLRYALLLLTLLDNYYLVTVFTNSFKISSTLRPSASALKLGNTLCLKIGIANDGQILVDKTKSYKWEKGEWENKDSFLKV